MATGFSNSSLGIINRDGGGGGNDDQIKHKLLIGSNAKKVVFAEVEKNFVDFLFHILSLPIGRVTKLLKEKGMNGCFHNIYESKGVYKICPICKNSMSMVVPAVVQPVGAATDGGFVMETVKYMVMDDLVVKPLSVSNIIGHVKNVVALHEEVVLFGIEEVHNLF
ncbi:hypothetical protein H5410_033688 [Solanum commersonii]|uniref:Uncharacterized protein n=1 Tax=Solanum commersonii TaxID=4109 RepID=A0A9J5YTT7_SOLCO|nr:hypothetical protein H5410_033688 [Solanum commersonii]